MSNLNPANTNSLWSSVLVEVLHRCGLKHIVISPGSRSSPLTVAFAAHPEMDSIPVLDERSAGFFALGIAKQTHRPVALVCTSGTAAVNYFPAVVEASEARVPLFVLTADRPPELRDCGAGQTIDQIRLYGNYPVYQKELPLPVCGLAELQDLKQILVESYKHALTGPIHLNCPFRDPLPPVEDNSTVGSPDIGDPFYADLQEICGRKAKSMEPVSLSAKKGIIICGTEAPLDCEGYCRSVAQLSESSGWPVLADGLSPVRNFSALQNKLITSYDLLLRNSTLRQSLIADCVIALGPLPTSKVLRKWLVEADSPMYHIHRTGKNLDPTGTVVQVLGMDFDQVPLCFSFTEKADTEYVTTWISSQYAAQQELQTAFESQEAEAFEGSISWMLPMNLPPQTPIFVASSMPVRDVEYFWPPNDEHFPVFASRGANGIDGTLSTALGVAYKNQSAILLTGDLAFLHDSNGLLIRPHFKGHLTVVLINNRGGGIFNHLPISEFEPPFEKFFATPQDVDFKYLVESTKCAYFKLHHLSELPALIRELPIDGIRVIEIETNRHRDSEYRKTLFNQISQSLA